MSERLRWILHIKELRAAHGVSILEAEKLALADTTWRRWVERRIMTDQSCNRMARQHIRYNGDDALIGKDGERVFVR